jgi:adenine-specific DNA-methyltransferase
MNFMDKTLTELNTKFDEILQIDQADLDFGIYRILNFYRGRIKQYLSEDLMRDIESAFAKYKGKQVEVLQKELAELRNTLVNAGVGDVDSVPKIIEFKELIALADDVTNLEESVLSDLLDFFRHYYSDGDFINQPRYADKEYYIPYSGEEVKLHWANAGQYYVKTAERFRDYRFKLANDKFVNFKLVSANTEEGNKKTQDKERRFVFCGIVETDAEMQGHGDAENNAEARTLVRAKNSELTISFAYQADDAKRSQKDINAETINKIINETDGLVEWRKFLSDKMPTAANANRTVLEKYLNDYTAKNTFDYFIHPKLDDFLTNELDFYIKRRVLRLENIENETPERVSLHLAKVKALRIVGGKIIKLLAQIENFQKKLFLKKKFVVQADYCLSLDKIDKSFYAEIVENKAQIAEWKELFKIDSIKADLFNHALTNVRASASEAENCGNTHEVSVSFLESNPHLLIDTKHFNEDFKLRLLASIENLDEQTDGLLIKSDNFQALNLLQEKYREAVKCIYIDPPYNTDSAPIAYKNGYKHSSWLTLINQSADLAKKLLSSEAIQIVAIDEYELRFLMPLLDLIFSEDNFISLITSICNPQGRVADKVSKTAEYHLVYAKDKENVGTLFVDKLENKRDLTPFKRTGTNSRREDRELRFYPILEKNGILSMISKDEYLKIFDRVTRTFNDEYVAELRQCYENKGYNVVLPQKEDGTFLVWQREFKRATIEINSYIFKNGAIYTPGFEMEIPKTCWTSPKFANPEYGTELLKNIISTEIDLSGNTAKSVYTLEQMLKMNDDELVIDYFGGSGTTGHAVINLNREDGGRRKFILVEANDYFETVLKPRILKVLYAPEWKDGMPKTHTGGTSAIIKYITLESYEDAMNNLYPREDTAETQEAMLNFGTDFREDFLLNYLLDFELSGSLLNLEMFAKPFAYEMEIAANGVGETRRTKVNLIETFNYLIGLTVDKTWIFGDLRLTSGNLRNGQKVLTIWRNLDDEQANEKLKQLTETIDLSQFEAVYLNGDSLIGTYRHENETWEIKSIEAEFFGKMFSE